MKPIEVKFTIVVYIRPDRVEELRADIEKALTKSLIGNINA